MPHLLCITLPPWVGLFLGLSVLLACLLANSALLSIAVNFKYILISGRESIPVLLFFYSPTPRTAPPAPHSKIVFGVLAFRSFIANFVPEITLPVWSV